MRGFFLKYIMVRKVFVDDDNTDVSWEIEAFINTNNRICFRCGDLSESQESSMCTLSKEDAIEFANEILRLVKCLKNEQ